MPHARFNWTARPAPPNEGRFGLGETLRLSDTVLTKGECGQGCTLEGREGGRVEESTRRGREAERRRVAAAAGAVLLEHQTKASQLQLVCNATALELKVALKMAPEYK